MAEIAEVSAAVEMTDKVDKLLRDNVVTAVINQLLAETKKHIEKLEKWASDIEKFTVEEGLTLMRKAVALGEDVKAYGEDWKAQKQQWCKQAETLAELLQEVDMDTEDHMEVAESLVDEIVEGTKEYLTRGRALKKQVEDVKAQSKYTEERIKQAGETLVNAMEQKKKDEKNWHWLWATAAINPLGLLVGAIATIIVEFKNIPELEDKIDEVQNRVKQCTEFWGDIRNLCDNMSNLLEKWIEEVKAIKAAALEFQNKKNAGAKFNKKLKGKGVAAKTNKFFQKKLIASFLQLSATLREYA